MPLHRGNDRNPAVQGETVDVVVGKFPLAFLQKQQILLRPAAREIGVETGQDHRLAGVVRGDVAKCDDELLLIWRVNMFCSPDRTW